MTIDYKTALGLLAAVISIVGYIPYFRDMLADKTKPHAFTWLIWGILNAIAFAGQLHGKGGPGMWAVGITAAALFVIFVFALFKGEKHLKPFDWLCLGGAGVALLLWLATSDPLGSIVLITIIDAFGFLPTVRKAYAKPFQETLVTYQVNTVKYVLIVLALQHYSLITTLFPLAVGVMNGMFALMLISRRQYAYARKRIV